tara:strand:- start:71 stop:1312 length:1242 start_codon:yes stop_codon:yes gene_type:complete
LARKTLPWEKSLRDALRGQCGKGWTCQNKRGKIQVQIIFDDGHRTALTTELIWEGSNHIPFLGLCERLQDLMVSQHLGIAEAYKLIDKAEIKTNKSDELAWRNVIDKYKESKINSGEVTKRTWEKNQQLRMNRCLEVLEALPRPINAKELLEKIIKKYPTAAGKTGRRRQVQDVADLLRFAVSECGVPTRWMPPEKQFLTKLIGVNKEKEDSTAIKDEQVIRLLASIDDPQMKNAIGLMACFGLRGVEVGNIQANGATLYCTYRKKTARKPEGTKPRDIVGLDPIGLEGLSNQLLAKLRKEGNKCLPLGCRDKEDAGYYIGDFLKDHPMWRTLVKETANNPRSSGQGNALTPYSLRHGYSYRASEIYGMSDRISAANMGHSLQTHNAHYGQWFDKSDIEKTLEKVKAVQKRAA